MFRSLFHMLAGFNLWPLPIRWISHSRPIPGRTGKSGVAAIRRAARKRKHRQKKGQRHVPAVA